MRWLLLNVVFLGVGCAAVDFPGSPSPGDLAGDMQFDELPRISRGQRGDDVPVQLAQAPPVAKAPAPPPPLETPKTSIELPPPPPPLSGGIVPVSNRSDRSARAAVRAWVNGRPIFQDEVLLEMEMRNPSMLYEASLEKRTKAFNDTLEKVIELEIAYQDAVKKLEKNSPPTLAKIKDAVQAEFEKQARNIRKSGSEEKFNEVAAAFRRQLERQFIGGQYIQSRVSGELDKIGYLQIKEYYDTHLNEFQKVDSVQWQHVFLAVNAKRSTVAEAQRQGEQMLMKVRSAPVDRQKEEFEALSIHDDGDSKIRKSMGLGRRKGEIQPAELEKYLFTLETGQLGPVVPISTGVHLFRVVEREHAGQLPLNEQVQQQIRNKLRNKIFEQEFNRFVRDLKDRAVIQREKS